MTASAQAYGYAHRGLVVGPSELDGYWMVRCSAINPMRPVGPYASTVPDLAVDDRVLLTQIGTTRDDLVITGKLPAEPWDSHLPIGIGDVSGLQAALDGRATDGELAALAGTVDSQGSAITTIQGLDVVQNGRLSALEAADIVLANADAALAAADAALDGRLDIVEPAVTANGLSIAAHTGQIAALQAADTAFATYSAFNQQHDVDVYGDAISSMPRFVIAANRTITSNVAFAFRTQARRAFNISVLRVICTLAGIGAGTTTAVLYRSASPTGAQTQAAAATNTLATLGEASFTLGSTAIAAGDWLTLVVRAAGYSTFPQIGTPLSQVKNSAHNPSVLRNAYAIKTMTGTPPTTIDITDGTWNNTDPTPWWVSLA